MFKLARMSCHGLKSVKDSFLGNSGPREYWVSKVCHGFYESVGDLFLGDSGLQEWWVSRVRRNGEER